MTKEDITSALIFGAVFAAIISFIYSPKTFNSYLVISGFALSSGYWLVYLIKNRLTPSKTYLCGMGITLQMVYSTTQTPTIIIWMSIGLFVFYCIAFVKTFYSECRDFKSIPHMGNE